MLTPTSSSPPLERLGVRETKYDDVKRNDPRQLSPSSSSSSIRSGKDCAKDSKKTYEFFQALDSSMALGFSMLQIRTEEVPRGPRPIFLGPFPPTSHAYEAPEPGPSVEVKRGISDPGGGGVSDPGGGGVRRPASLHPPQSRPSWPRSQIRDYGLKPPHVDRLTTNTPCRLEISEWGDEMVSRSLAKLL